MQERFSTGTTAGYGNDAAKRSPTTLALTPHKAFETRGSTPGATGFCRHDGLGKEFRALIAVSYQGLASPPLAFLESASLTLPTATPLHPSGLSEAFCSYQSLAG